MVNWRLTEVRCRALVAGLVNCVLALGLSAAQADSLQSFVQAKQVAAQSHRPLLLEFYHDDCEHCFEFMQEADTSGLIQSVLDSLVYYPLSVLSLEGDSLSGDYDVGSTYPVFVLMNSEAEVVKRWTGYAGAQMFVATLSGAMQDLAGVDDRLARYREHPTYDDAVSLAKYYSDIGQHLKGIEFYRQADSLNPRPYVDHSYEIFNNTANLVWNGELDYEAALMAADAVLSSRSRNITNIAKVGNLMGQLARRENRSDGLAKYLDAGIKATAGKSIENLQQYHTLLKADYALHVDGDTAAALEIRKSGMGPTWEQDRDKFFSFAKWCLERKINLAEAEQYTRKTLNLVFPGRVKAMVLNTLAEICAARGNYQEAVRVAELAVRENPDSEYYDGQLERFRQELLKYR